MALVLPHRLGVVPVEQGPQALCAELLRALDRLRVAKRLDADTCRFDSGPYPRAMAKVKSSAPRFRSERTALGLRLILRRPWTPIQVLLVVFLGAWLGGWGFGEVAAIRELLGEDSIEGGSPGLVAFWLVGWTVAGVAVLYGLLWNLVGRESSR